MIPIYYMHPCVPWDGINKIKTKKYKNGIDNILEFNPRMHTSLRTYYVNIESIRIPVQQIKYDNT